LYRDRRPCSLWPSLLYNLGRDKCIIASDVLEARRISLAASLLEVYPIVELQRGSLYSIRGAKLPLPKAMSGYEEEEVSTALGYTAHLLALLSKYLQVKSATNM
jgi:hypothetical protein